MFKDVFIDNEAKLRIDLVHLGRGSIRDGSDTVEVRRYRGKLQFPGTLNLSRGLCSMIFLSDEGREELQLSGVIPHKRSKDNTPSRGITDSNKLIVRLTPFSDRTSQRGFVGEIEAPTLQLNAERGIEFTVNSPRVGRGEMLIGQLNNYEDQIDEDASLRIDLFRAKDNRHRPFYRGKLQFPGTLDLELGASLKVVTTPRCEELRINILGATRSSTYRREDEWVGGASGQRGRFYAPLRKSADGIYFTDLQIPFRGDCDLGYYFTIFTNEGREEIQIARIDPSQVKARQRHHRWPVAANE